MNLCTTFEVVEIFLGPKWWTDRMTTTDIATTTLEQCHIHNTQTTTIIAPDVKNSKTDITTNQNMSLLFLQIWEDCVNKGDPGQEHQPMQRLWLCGL